MGCPYGFALYSAALPAAALATAAAPSTSASTHVGASMSFAFGDLKDRVQVFLGARLCESIGRGVNRCGEVCREGRPIPR